MDRVRRRIQDHKVLRLVLAFLKADIMIEGSLRHPVTGTPQGGIISPMRSNIFLHNVLDKWFEDVVRPRRRGKATLVRFADDFVMTFETHYDAKLVMDVLGKRLGRFGLTLHPDKTRFIDFRPQCHGGTPPDCKAQSFDFLGFTHSWQKSRKGKDVVRRTTAKAASPARWSRSRNGAGPTGIGLHANSAPGCLRYSMVTMPTMASRETFGGSRSIATKLRGSGTSGWNVEREAGCSYGLTSERSSPVIRCQWPGSSTVTPAGTNLSREEPDAGIPLVRVCGGRGGNLLAYPAPLCDMGAG